MKPSTKMSIDMVSTSAFCCLFITGIVRRVHRSVNIPTAGKLRKLPSKAKDATMHV